MSFEIKRKLCEEQVESLYKNATLRESNADYMIIVLQRLALIDKNTRVMLIETTRKIRAKEINEIAIKYQIKQ